MWSFKVIKQLFPSFTSIWLTTSLFSNIFFPSALTLLIILSEIFLYVKVIASVFNLLYSSLLILDIFDALSAKTKNFFDFFIVLVSSFKWFRKVLQTFRKFILLIKSHKSRLNETNFFELLVSVQHMFVAYFHHWGWCTNNSSNVCIWCTRVIEK